VAGVSVAAPALSGDSSSGRWDYCIGLVGKPSAGKSTFFNAGTDPREEHAAARYAPPPSQLI
jgi:ATPase subunit of ABC transporter with duplicated ATPase domains